MLLSQRRTKCREFTGPTPHSVALRAKFPSRRPVDHLILDRQKQDAAREEIQDFTKHQQSFNIKTSWLQTSDQRFLKGSVQRQVRAALTHQEVHVDQRRDRLRVLLEEEEQQLLQEMEEKMETSVERQAKMRERAKALRERRETDRQKMVSEKMDQLFRDQCEELRTVQSQRREQQVCLERAAQLESQQQQRQRQRQEEQLFAELWDADRRAKDQKAEQEAQQRQTRNLQTLDAIRTQMEAAEQQRQKHKELREEEAALMREQQLTLQQQQQHRRQLDQGLRMKMKRLAREQQDQLELDMSILQTLLQQETDQKQEAAHRKVELREEQQRYRQYLSAELQKQRREEEETEQLMEDKLKEVWSKREEQSRLQREARNRLMQEVMEARSLQILHKLELNMKSQAELSKERDDLNRAMEEMKLMDNKEKRRQQQRTESYQADLQAQMKYQQQLLFQQKAQEEREHQQGLMLQDEYQRKKDHILSRPSSHTAGTAVHPFRQTDRSRSAPRHPPAHDAL
ncbi:cilia- and flagella-associated protein 53 isoform X2 [Sander lucioperca]|uniref:cilia- and flagella-associated protein 53 isoform X2 n=1 Tax=Sander lucioperca TaxID=283035 RepID=UPI0016536E31|nr:cilia- and flagella-associated protein 53 isoform X2 [Sander lucioperca]